MVLQLIELCIISNIFIGLSVTYTEGRRTLRIYFEQHVSIASTHVRPGVPLHVPIQIFFFSPGGSHGTAVEAPPIVASPVKAISTISRSGIGEGMGAGGEERSGYLAC